MPDQLENNYYEQLCQHAGVALIGTDEHLQIRFCNQAAKQIFDQTSGDMSGMPLTSIFDNNLRREIKDLFHRALDEGKVSDFEFAYPRHGVSNHKHLAVTISPIIENNKPNGISLCIRDITLKRELLRDIASSQKMSALGVMAGAVAHHFNNLIGGIITSIDFTLLSDNLSIYRKTLQTTADCLTRANKLTLNLLAFAEGSRRETQTQNISEIVEQYLQTIREKLTNKKIILKTHLDSIDVQIPSMRMLTILDNIIDNACDAMPNGGNLQIYLQKNDKNNEIMLRIIDSGHGIRPEHLEHLFEPFFTTKRGNEYEQSPHMGLGLAVVHGIINDIGGSISITSTCPGQTICTIQIPIPAQP